MIEVNTRVVAKFSREKMNEGRKDKKARTAVIIPTKKIYRKSCFPKIIITLLGFSLIMLLSFGEKARAIAGSPSVTRLI